MLSLFPEDIESHATAASTEEARRILQSHQDGIDEWAFKWRLAFSTNKGVAMVFSRRINPVGDLLVSLAGVPIKVVPSYKILGVTFDNRQHCQHI